jgi:biotin operon repressor
MSSYKALQKLAQNQSKVPFNLRPTLFAIASFLPRAFPSLCTLAKMTGRSRSSIIRDIKKLEQLNIMLIDRKAGITNLYKIRDPEQYHSYDTGAEGNHVQDDTPPVP